MDLNLTGKVTVITGGTAGIGEACVLAFLQEGCKVAVCGRSQENLERLQTNLKAQGYEILIYKADVSKQQEIKEFAHKVYDSYGKIDIWVNNAGISCKARLIDMAEDDWDKVLDINLKSVFLGAQAAAQYMRKDSGGVIINASSYAAVIPSVGAGAYAASKAAVSSLTRTLAAELAPYNIRVNGYIPGVIDTQMNAKRLEVHAAETIGQIALNRVGSAKEVADGIVFLASDAASYITGIDLEISGGKFAVQIPRESWQS
ncbi:SDR family oxidoreductase [Sporomusa sp.]|uniref:SDR family NAD(P)-dependent oxidoreductase n=1 Tax=Sporomusa sp. TaxID=2078658 RepID=UPI002CCECF6B|nr:SDR family oxidoreductase [Sporomusa sp.]HWR45404.1 SDR family oxidoreductase [Sporomusa sp.]